MEAAMRRALRHYVKVVKEKGWRAGDSLIAKHGKQWPDFKKWAKALRILIRAEELLKEHRTKKKKK